MLEPGLKIALPPPAPPKTLNSAKVQLSAKNRMLSVTVFV